MTADKGSDTRALVLVSGMHRCGTSATAGALTLLGADAGSRLAPARPENSKGFFELLPLVDVHDEILARCGYTWDDPRPLDIASYPRTFRSEARRAILKVIEEELSLTGLTVVKDPRAARLIPLWIEVFEELELEPRFLHAYRSPDAVAASLGRRSGMADGHARQLWLEHVLAMEHDTRGFTRSFVECERLVSEPVENLARVAVQLGIDLAASVASRRSELETFLESALLNHPERAAKLSVREAAVLKDVRSLVVRDVAAAQKRLDAIAAGEESTADAFAYASHLHLDVKQRISKIIERSTVANERLSAIERSHAERLGQVNRHLGQIEKSLDRPELKNLEAWRVELDQLRARTTSGGAKFEALEASFTDLDQSIEGRIQSASEVQRNALNALDSRLDSTERLLHTEVREANTREERAQKDLSTMRTEMTGYARTSEVEEARRDLETTSRAVAKATNGLAEIRQQLESSLGSISGDQAEIQRLLASVEAAVDGNDVRIAQLEKQLHASATSVDEELSLIRSEVAEMQRLLENQEASSQAAVDAIVGQRLAAAVGEVNAALDHAKAGYTSELLRFVELLPTAADFAQLRDRVDLLSRGAARTQEPVVDAAPPVSPAEYVPVDDLPAFPSHWAPTVSIIVPAYNQSHLTIECLRSVAKNPPSVPFEVIIADDFSNEAEFENVRNIEGVTVVTMDRNGGFGANCNNAARHARGEYLYFLNNDAALRPGSVDNLLGTFTHFPKTGIAGSKLVFPDGTTQDAGGIIWRDGGAWNYGRGRSANDPASSYCRVADYVAGASLMITRTLFSDLGGFDPLYAPAYYEDVDLCMKVASLDLEVRFQPASVVTHEEGRSYGTSLEQEGKHHQVLNAQKFFDRWEQQLSSHRVNGDEPELEKDRSAGQRVLALFPDAPDSGREPDFSALEQLSTLGAKVVLFAPENAAGVSDQKFGALQFMGVEVVASSPTFGFEDFLAERAGEFDVVIACGIGASASEIGLLRSARPEVRIMLDASSLDNPADLAAIPTTLIDGLLVRADDPAGQRFGAETREFPLHTLTIPPLAQSAQGGTSAAMRLVGTVAATPQTEQWIVDELIRSVTAGVPGVDFVVLDGTAIEECPMDSSGFGELSNLTHDELVGAIQTALSEIKADDRHVEVFQSELAALCPGATT